MPYIFVGASIASVVPIIILFRVFVERIKENPDNKEKLFVQFLIGISIVEMIPIILVVLGMANAAPVSDVSELYFPGGLIILTAGFGVLLIFLQQYGDIRVDTVQYRMISMVLIGSIPTVSLIGIFMMIPQ